MNENSAKFFLDTCCTWETYLDETVYAFHDHLKETDHEEQAALKIAQKMENTFLLVSLNTKTITNQNEA